MVRLAEKEMPKHALRKSEKSNIEIFKGYYSTTYCRRFSVVGIIVIALAILAIIFFRDLLVLPTIYGFIVGGTLLLSYALFSLVRKRLEL